MKKYFQMTFIFALILTFLSSCQSSSDKGVNITEWEYMTVTVENRLYGVIGVDYLNERLCEGHPCFLQNADVKMVNELNRYGKQGWELIDIGGDIYSTTVVMLFKRPKQ